jgi:hypothetical protein
VTLSLQRHEHNGQRLKLAVRIDVGNTSMCLATVRLGRRAVDAAAFVCLDRCRLRQLALAADAGVITSGRAHCSPAA